MSKETSIGPADQRGGNEDHGNADGCGNKTLGDHAVAQAPEAPDLLDEANAQVPAGVDAARGKRAERR